MAVTVKLPEVSNRKVVLLALVMAGAWFTVSVAVLLAAPVPPSVELITPVTLFLTPAVVPVTLSEMVHVLLAVIEPPLRPTDVLPPAAVNVPPQVFDAPGLLAT